MRTKLDEAIKALAEVLPPESAKALGLEQDVAQPAPAPSGVGAPDAPAGSQGDRGEGDEDGDEDAPLPEVTKGLAEDGTEVSLLGMDDLGALIKGIVRTETAKAINEALKGLPARLDRLETAALAGLEAHKAVGTALNLAQRHAAARPSGAGRAVSSFPQGTTTPAAAPARLTFDEALKAVDEGLLPDSAAGDKAMIGVFPQGTNAEGIRQALNKS